MEIILGNTSAYLKASQYVLKTMRHSIGIVGGTWEITLHCLLSLLRAAMSIRCRVPNSGSGRPFWLSKTEDGFSLFSPGYELQSDAAHVMEFLKPLWETQGKTDAFDVASFECDWLSVPRFVCVEMSSSATQAVRAGCAILKEHQQVRNAIKRF